MKLLVRNLSRSTTEQDLRVLFSEFGNVTHCDLVLDQNTGKSKGFAFIEMPSSGEAREALKKLNLTNVSGKSIRVKIAD